MIGTQNTFDVDGIRDGLKKALSNADCAKFVDSLLRAVAATKKNSGSAGYGNPIGHIAKGDAAIFVVGGASDSAIQLAGDIRGILHELMHMAGQKKNYTARAFAEIVRRELSGSLNFDLAW
jgi:hypothetical protein